MSELPAADSVYPDCHRQFRSDGNGRVGNSNSGKKCDKTAKDGCCLQTSQTFGIDNSYFRKYWEQYLKIADWFKKHNDYLESMREDKQQYDKWCMSQMAYHRSMVEAFGQRLSFSQDNNSAAAMVGAASNLIHPRGRSGCRMQVDGPSANQNIKRVSRSSSRSSRKRKSRRRKRARCNVELHLANVDLDNGDLDIGFDGCDSAEFEMEISEDMVNFFSHSAQHRKERGVFLFSRLWW